MRNRLAAATLLTILALGVAWLVSRGDRGVAVATEPLAHDRVAETNSVGALEAPTRSAVREVTTATGATPPDMLEDVGLAPVETDPSAARDWVEGRVEFPPGMPSDERAFVSVVVPAINHNFHDSEPVRFPVGADGRFRFPVPENAWTLELDVVGRYLHTPRPRALRVGALPPDIVLRPTLGACVRVVLAPSPELLARGFDPAGASVQRWGKSVDLTDVYLDMLRNATTDATGAALVEGLDVERSWTVTAWANGTLPANREVPPLRAGELRDLVVPLDAAPHFSGVVRDEHGVPIEGASVVLSIATEDGARPTYGGTAADGRFHLHAFAAGTAHLRVTCSGYAARELGPWSVDIGSDVTGIDVVLAGGAEITGVVRWPDGGAWMFVERGAPVDAAQRERVAVGPDGAFRVLGVAGETCVLHARGRARIDRDDRKSPYMLWTARAEVRAPASDVVLVPSPGSSLRGRVSDDHGIAVAGAQVLATLVQRENEDGYITPVETDADGWFLLDRLRDGAWRISASARGSYCDAIVVEMPGEAASPVQLVLTRGGVLEGRVVDARGDPVGGANVVLEAKDENWANHGSLPTAVSSADGSFRIDSLRGGTLHVSARKDGHARAIGLAVEVAPGRTTSGVELALRAGGTIDVRVLDAGGIPVADEELGLRREGVEFLVGSARTDASGRARFEDVDEGQLIVGPPSLRGRSTYRSAAVEVESGVVSSVVLRP